MSDRYEHEILLEEPGTEDRPRVGAAGVAVGVGLAAILLLGLFIGGRAAADWIGGLSGFGGPPDVTAEVVPGRTVVVEIAAGSSARQIGALLVQQGVIASSGEFESEVRSRDASSSLKAGDYELISGMAIGDIIDALIEGPNLTTVRVTIVEGRRIGEVLEDLARQTDFTRDEFAAALLDGSVRSIYLPEDEVGIQAWEGLLFPDTYEFFAASTPPEMLQRLANEMERRVSQLDWEPVREAGYSIYEGIVMASMIEAEAGIDDDRPRIASVLYNRLDLGMMLQIDATVLYALGQRRTGLTLEDLEVESPYNTYQVTGLPPTPIGAPGFLSLQAVVAPAETEFLYYVLSSPDGAHTFTATYEDFLVAKEQAREDGLLP